MPIPCWYQLPVGLKSIHRGKENSSLAHSTWNSGSKLPDTPGILHWKICQADQLFHQFLPAHRFYFISILLFSFRVFKTGRLKLFKIFNLQKGIPKNPQTTINVVNIITRYEYKQTFSSPLFIDSL